ncbi:MAG TPA: cytochrome C, partial [Casimicrobiaceae bacterium]|nr:cytochrome C [Casimicrobiaceae bacterium]
MHLKSGLLPAIAGVVLLSHWSDAIGVPSFARQTGFECATCHLSWPELTSVGRQFKLGGYTLLKETKGERPLLPSGDDSPPIIPLAAMFQGSFTSTHNTTGVEDDFPRNNGLVLQTLSGFIAGRIVEHFGAFAQWTYDGVAHHSSVDNIDLRLAAHYTGGGLDVSYGATVNNNPTVSDIYNSTPAWGFPFASSGVAATPNAATLIDGGLAQQVVGLGGYAMWNSTLYTEVAAYRTADGAFSVFRAGTDKTTDAVLDGAAPYWRIALQHVSEGGTHSAMIGTYGLVADKFPDSLAPTGPTDRYRNIGIDGQYQYVTDRHRFSTQLTWIDENQNLAATYAAGGSSNPTDTLHTFRAKATYYYDEKYGATLSYFRTTGSIDD